MTTQTHAARFVAAMKDRPHPSTHRHALQDLRASFQYTDDGYTETFTLTDGSRVAYDHSANPGFNWSVVEG